MRLTWGTHWHSPTRKAARPVVIGYQTPTTIPMWAGRYRAQPTGPDAYRNGHRE